MAPCSWPRTQPLAQRCDKTFWIWRGGKTSAMPDSNCLLLTLLHYFLFILMVVDDRQSPQFFSPPQKHHPVVAGGSPYAPFVSTVGLRRVSAYGFWLIFNCIGT
ncbi:hypothetical protein P168DRAFT_145688 [Aspergillus campestris IBT 28561]|uniref:Uncharacterized protein n=1 Tax=Aspergillus campestris (strain IBT 28561) TaxID=1392248 RepID=A0A2I1D5G0_ASPC2|nr:uncharacterized protein P168DRAFT_145688 [Aspergillus campestris IBT 28561]PKY05114.1 hypothetical protein P168DRAFT_145688 [Aspergillus campestris IBT 28561]